MRGDGNETSRTERKALCLSEEKDAARQHPKRKVDGGEVPQRDLEHSGRAAVLLLCYAAQGDHPQQQCFIMMLRPMLPLFRAWVPPLLKETLLLPLLLR